MKRIHPSALLAAALLLGACDSPTDTERGRQAVALALGDAHTCALMASDDVWCWGDNAYGQLGTGQAGGSSLLPVKVEGAPRFRELMAGGDRTCGLTEGGELWCWGRSSTFGELGVTTQQNPAPIRVASGRTWAQASVATFHLCGVTTAGEAFCWGRNNQGQLGIGITDANPHAAPVAVAGGLRFRSVSASTILTCGVTTEGRAYCWGRSWQGQVFPNGQAVQPAPVAFAPELSFSSVQAGTVYACGQVDGGGVYCWGSNDFGQFGTGGYEGGPTPVRALSGLEVESFAVNAENTFASQSCAVAEGGEGFCWGIGEQGQLGNPAAELEECPAAPLPACAPEGTSVVSVGELRKVDVGLYHACAITGRGDVLCWGRGAEGQLGWGLRGNTATPVAVILPPRDSGEG